MLEPRECIEVLSKAKDRYRFDHELEYIAISNALGKAFSKNYKYNDVFKDSDNKEINEDEKQKMREYFENW